MAMKPFEILEHTADVAILARGHDLCELIANAAAGMLAVLFSGPAPPAERYVERVVQGATPELLVHHVLRELLYLLEDEGLAAVSVVVSHCSATEAALRIGVAKRETVGALLGAPVKAVTRHALGIEEQAGLLTTRIVFDV